MRTRTATLQGDGRLHAHQRVFNRARSIWPIWSKRVTMSQGGGVNRESALINVANYLGNARRTWQEVYDLASKMTNTELHLFCRDLEKQSLEGQ